MAKKKTESFEIGIINLNRLVLLKQAELKKRNDYIKASRCIRCNNQLAIKECHDEYILLECLNTLCKKIKTINYKDIK